MRLNALRAALAVTLLLALAACDDENAPYLEFAGGGFIFNYNVADAYYGFVVKRLRRIPEGTIIEARFEDPAGGPPLTETQTAQATLLQYLFRSPALTGIEAGRDYTVEVRLIDPETGQPFARYARSFRSDLDQTALPARPTTVGPGYQPAPAAGTDRE